MAIQLSDTDKAIINALQRDGKATNASIAKDIGVSEETIRRRSHRLVIDEVIKVTGIPDASKLGYECEALIGIQTAPDKLDDVASALSALDEVSVVTITTGSYDIFAEVRLISHADLLGFMTGKVSSIPGVVRTETFINLATPKRDYSLSL